MITEVHSGINCDYDLALVNAGISEAHRPHFRRWIGQYNRFCARNAVPDTAPLSLDAYIAELSSQGREDWQCRQARRAVELALHPEKDGFPGVEGTRGAALLPASGTKASPQTPCARQDRVLPLPQSIVGKLRSHLCAVQKQWKKDSSDPACDGVFLPEEMEGRQTRKRGVVPWHGTGCSPHPKSPQYPEPGCRSDPISTPRDSRMRYVRPRTGRISPSE